MVGRLFYLCRAQCKALDRGLFPALPSIFICHHCWVSGNLSHITNPVMQPILEFSPSSLFIHQSLWICHLQGSISKLCNISFRPGGWLQPIKLYSKVWYSYVKVLFILVIKIFLHYKLDDASFIKKYLVIQHLELFSHSNHSGRGCRSDPVVTLKLLSFSHTARRSNSFSHKHIGLRGTAALNVQ